MTLIDCVALMSRVACRVPMRKRLTQVMARMTAQPAASFPTMMRDEAGCEGFYRMLQNDDVSFEKVLEPHVQDSIEKCVGAGRVLVLHDTTECRFGGERQREGLGRLNKNDHGFLVHAGLAVTDDDAHLPIGVLNLESLVRHGAPVEASFLERYGSVDKESLRWARGVDIVESQLGPGTALHVMDREADNYVLLAQMQQNAARFIVRANAFRTLHSPDKKKRTVQEFFANRQGRFRREVPIHARTPKRTNMQRRKHADRQQRTALLHFNAGTLQIHAASYVDKKKYPVPLTVNIVHITEDPSTVPEGEKGVEWFLTTSEPIETQQQIEAIVDAYRARWGIEEFFKALKTGCSFERRQLESLDALLIVLAMFVPIATNLLRLRTMCRSEPDRPATDAMPAPLLKVLVATTPLKHKPANTVTEVLNHVAALGGHLRNNGPPGWLVLARGYETLCMYAAGWAARGRN